MVVLATPFLANNCLATSTNNRLVFDIDIYFPPFIRLIAQTFYDVQMYVFYFMRASIQDRKKVF
jgi:hypothetical protein